MRIRRLQLHTRIVIGLLAGVLLGSLANRLGYSEYVSAYIKPFGTLFIRLISMVVVPLVFASLVVGTAGLDDARKLGRIGLKTLVFYTCTTVIAICGGFLLANTIRPGAGLPEDTRAQLAQGGREQADEKAAAAEDKPDLKDVLLDIIPRNPIAALAEGNMLQIIVFALLFGICLTMIPAEQSRPVTGFFDGVNAVMIQIVRLVVRLAPYGVFALIADVTADFGLDMLLVLLKYAVTVVVGLALHMAIVYSLAIRGLSRRSVTEFFKGIRPAQLIAFSSSSSSATLPVTIECTQRNLGVSRQVSSFVLPLGATLNMDGSALYQGVSAVFIAQVYGIDLTITQQLMIVITATLASVGTAGTPMAGIVTLAIVLRSIGVPAEGIGLIFGVERLLDMCRTVVNVTGDACCAAVVDSTENKRQKA